MECPADPVTFFPKTERKTAAAHYLLLPAAVDAALFQIQELKIHIVIVIHFQEVAGRVVSVLRLPTGGSLRTGRSSLRLG